jgi:hypothetical protein
VEAPRAAQDKNRTTPPTTLPKFTDTALLRKGKKINEGKREAKQARLAPAGRRLTESPDETTTESARGKRVVPTKQSKSRVR